MNLFSISKNNQIIVSINFTLLCKTTQRFLRLLLPLFEALQPQAWRTHAWCRAVRSKLIQWSLKRIQPPSQISPDISVISRWRCLSNFNLFFCKETVWYFNIILWMCFSIQHQLGNIQTSVLWSIQICSLPKLPTMDPPIRSKAYLDRSKRSAPVNWVNWLCVHKYDIIIIYIYIRI